MNKEDATLPPNQTEVVFMPKDWTITNDASWDSVQKVSPDSYRCGFCGYDVASETGWQTSQRNSFVRICPQCNVPTFFSHKGLQIPGPKWGGGVAKLPEDVQSVYDEARASLTVNAFTGVVMLCRKMLMHVAVEKKAPEGQDFVSYVEWLIKERYAPSRLRKKGVCARIGAW